MSKRWLIGGLVIAIPLVAWGVLTAASFAFRTTVEDSALISEPVERVMVDGDGSVKVVAADDADTISVDWRSRYFLDRPEVDWDMDGDTLTLAAECGTFGLITNCNTRFTLRVPAGLALDVETSSGDVEVEGRTGALALTTRSGDVVVEGRSPDISADTRSGDVEIAIAGEPPASVRAETRSGDVLVEVPNAAYAVETDTRSGDESVGGIHEDSAAPRTIVARTTSGDVTVRAG